MNPEHHHKTIAYIILGIIIVILLGIYIYSVLSSRQAAPVPEATTTAVQSVGLTPQEASVKMAAIDQLTAKVNAKMTPSQAAARASSLSALEAK